ncbi:SOS response-associated peptidase [Luteibacter sp. UNCMF331Sha3.1]|uniref:SOS response-associated peptidase n=1 Tax=Luteibacter sp. UNCMF331Sha3.1 TaxID=1502760 RepID=UPI000B7FAF33|nr:SOS response-associated peptidase [Luteibacter sp. UNCMF331Sha3.1]
MCGRYATFGPASLSREARAVLEELEVDIIGEINQREPNYNIAPTARGLIVGHGDAGYGVKWYRWGLVPSWAKDSKGGAKLFNARSETVATMPSFRAAFRKRRCLVPASGYFEWRTEEGARQPYFIHDPEGHLMMFAGLWEGWRASPDDDWLHTYTIVTGEPGRVTADIHQRQPVILPPDLWRVWMSGDTDEAAAVFAAVPEAPLAYHPVTKAVNSSRNQGSALIEPLGPDRSA